MTTPDLLAAYRHATNNRAEIEAGTVCGCFFCMKTFPPTEIIAWSGFDMAQLDNPQAECVETALCPHCGSESVIGNKSGYAINAMFLGDMHEAWFQRTIIHRPK